MASLGTVTFPQSQPDVSVEVQSRIVVNSFVDNGMQKYDVEYWVDMGDATAQVDTLTLTAGTAGDIYALDITVGGTTESVEYVMMAGDTADDIAAAIAAEFSSADMTLAAAAASSNVVTVTSASPGSAATLDVTRSTTPGNIAVANTVAASGTGNSIKVATHRYWFAVPSGGRNLACYYQNIFFDAAGTAVRTDTPLSALHSIAMETLMDNAGA